MVVCSIKYDLGEILMIWIMLFLMEVDGYS